MIKHAFHAIFLLIGISICMTWSACSPGGSRPDDEFLQYDTGRYERVSISYDIVGKGDTSLVFIHGWNLDHTYWDYSVEKLKNRYTIVSLDLAGHGNSGKDRTTWTAESFGRDILHIINKQKLKNVVLVAHSLGGEIALEVRNQIPDKIIAIIGVDNFKDVSFKVTPELRIDLKQYLARFKRNYQEMADSLARANIRSDNRDLINRIVKDYKSADPKIALAIYKNMVPKYASDKDQLQKLNFKLRIIASDYMPFNEDALRRYTPFGYDIIWINGAGHFPMVEQPEEFLAGLKKFLSELQQEKAPF